MFKFFLSFSSLLLIASQVECANPEKVTGSRSKRGIDIDSLQPVGFNANVPQQQTDTSIHNQHQQLDPSSYYQQQQQMDPSSYYQQQQPDPSYLYQQQPTGNPSININGYQYHVDPSQLQPVGFNAGIMSSDQKPGDVSKCFTTRWNSLI